MPAFSSASWVVAEVTPSVSEIWFTYWCLIVSVDCFHAGFLVIMRDLPGTSELIWYGPSDMTCWSNCALFGRSCRIRPAGPS